MATNVVPSVEPLSALYRIGDRERIGAFLGEHPALTELLRDAPAAIHASFESVRELSLHITTEPDDLTASSLVVLIHTDGDIDAALDQLDALDSDWWLPHMAVAGSRLIFDVASA